MLSTNETTALHAYERHYKHGRLGDLLYDAQLPFSVKRFPEIRAQMPESVDFVMFDNTFDEWVPFDPKNVPMTYTYAPRPQNVMMELDYLLRTVALVNHKYIWVDDADYGISRAVYSLIGSRTNRNFLGRFTVARNMPKIFNIAKMTARGFIEHDQSEFERFER